MCSVHLPRLSCAAMLAAVLIVFHAVVVPLLLLVCSLDISSMSVSALPFLRCSSPLPGLLFYRFGPWRAS